MKVSFNREQLKLIAICSMVVDHIAWGFVDFYSPLGQFLHILGRLTIPIMCFFIAEGYRKTSSLPKYIERMITFGICAIIPFYIFFHEEYGYRTNFIFDLLFGLLALTVLESSLRKWQKVLLMILIFAVSFCIGGWPVTPTLFIIIFYYGRTFREKAKWFILADVATVLFLVVGISLNSIYHFSHYEWVWWDKFYQLGFLLALPLLYCYNGEKGKPFLGRYFFYIFYCVHFLVLAAVKAVWMRHASAFQIDLAVHFIALLITWLILLLTMRCRPSRGQTAITFFLAFSSVYIFGFILEIISSSVEMFHLAILVEYFGEVMAFVGLLYFIKVLCDLRIPTFIYLIQVLFGIVITYMVLTTRKNGFFYQQLGINYDGPFPKPELDYGPGFFLTIAYIGILSIFCIAACIIKLRTGSNLDKRRIQLTILGFLLVWLPYPLKLTGISGGYEFPGVGIAMTGICFYLIILRYGFLDSVTLASENALDHGSEGIVVLGIDYMIQYHNKQLDDIFGDIPHDMDLRLHPQLKEILLENAKTLEINGRIYEFRLEVLKDNGFEQGYMLWIHDATDHYIAMQKMEEIATTDSLTKLYNRIRYQELVKAHLSTVGKGAFLMIDMDNFKLVNDQYGHQVGDDVLCALADILKKFPEDKLIGCRIGGDEFSVFLPDETNRERLGHFISQLKKDYQRRLCELGYAKYTSISAGAVICDLSRNRNVDFVQLYNAADRELYEVKANGKNQFRIREL